MSITNNTIPNLDSKILQLEQLIAADIAKKESLLYNVATITRRNDKYAYIYYPSDLNHKNTIDDQDVQKHIDSVGLQAVTTIKHFRVTGDFTGGLEYGGTCLRTNDDDEDGDGSLYQRNESSIEYSNKDDIDDLLFTYGFDFDEDSHPKVVYLTCDHTTRGIDAVQSKKEETFIRECMDTDYIYSSDDDVLMVTEYNFSYVKISLGQETTTTRIPLV